MISFEVGRNPKIASRPGNFRDYIPKAYDGVIIISADFELAWAWRFAKVTKDPKSESEAYAKKARKNIPVLLSLCEEFNIPITWGTVGHLFLEECKRNQAGIAHPEISRLNYFENSWWKYDKGDWFDLDPCSSLQEDDAWYAPDLIQKILDSPVNHEMGTHTFSHIDCTDQHCPPSVIEDELVACQKAADKFNVQLESFIFPGHTMGNFETIRKCGYTSVRTNYINEIGYPVKDEYGLWRFPATAEIIMKPSYSKGYNLYRYRKIIARTVKNKALTNLWFHPSLPCETVEPLFKSIFSNIRQYGDRIWVTTMKDYTKWLNSH